MTARRLLSFVLLVTVGVTAGHGLAQQSQQERSTQLTTSVPGGPPFWAGSGQLWFGVHPAGHELTVDEARSGLERWIAQNGNPRLKLGNVGEKDDRTITAEIVTVDNSLVQKLDIDRRTGTVWQMQRPDGWGMWQHMGPAHGMGWWGRTDGWQGWAAFHLIGMFLFLTFLVVIAALIATTFRGRNAGRGWWREGPYAPSSLYQIKTRYAHGEISRDEYLRQKGELSK